MVRQPREPVGEASLLELPAGKLDKEGETPLECAQRELTEEIGKAAGDWRELQSFYTSPGFADRALPSVPRDRALRGPRPSPRRASGSRSCGAAGRARRGDRALPRRGSLVGMLMLRRMI